MAVTHLLWQEVDPHGVFVTVGPELDLCQDLVGEGVAHDKAGVAHGTAQVDQAALGQQDDVAAVAQGVAIHLWEQQYHITRGARGPPSPSATQHCSTSVTTDPPLSIPSVCKACINPGLHSTPNLASTLFSASSPILLAFPHACSPSQL